LLPLLLLLDSDMAALPAEVKVALAAEAEALAVAVLEGALEVEVEEVVANGKLR